MSIYESKEKRLYSVHPEFVFSNDHNQDSTFLCQPCHKYFIEKKQVHPLSIAAGIDLGDPNRIGLQKMNIFERMLVAKMRLYHPIVKIQPKFQSNNLLEGKRMTGHAIMFPHDAPETTSFATLLHMMYNTDQSLNHTYMKKFCENLITVQFLCPEEKIDRLLSSTVGTHLIQARPHVVQQWLTVLQKVSSLSYCEDEDVTQMSNEIQTLIQLLNQFVKEGAQTETDEVVLHEEQKVTASNQPFTNNAEGLSYSLVTSPFEEKHAKMKVLEEKFQTLVSIAEACNIDVNRHNPYKWTSTRGQNPPNQFTMDDPQSLLPAAFPDVFPFGTTYGKSVHLSRRQL